jgi:hypothetical protein
VGQQNICEGHGNENGADHSNIYRAGIKAIMMISDNV